MSEEIYVVGDRVKIKKLGKGWDYKTQFSEKIVTISKVVNETDFSKTSYFIEEGVCIIPSEMIEKKVGVKDVIELTLHHDYFQIIRDGVKTQYPIRMAKLIKDMYELRNAENENKDLQHYSSYCERKNPHYNISVFVMNARCSSELQWINKKIKPFVFEEKK